MVQKAAARYCPLSMTVYSMPDRSRPASPAALHQPALRWAFSGGAESQSMLELTPDRPLMTTASSRRSARKPPKLPVCQKMNLVTRNKTLHTIMVLRYPIRSASQPQGTSSSMDRAMLALSMTMISKIPRPAAWRYSVATAA